MVKNNISFGIKFPYSDKTENIYLAKFSRTSSRSGCFQKNDQKVSKVHMSGSKLVDPKVTFG